MTKIYDYVNSRLETVEDENDSFETEIINHINDALAELTQIIKIESFKIADKDTLIQDLYPSKSIPEETQQLMLNYIGLSVRLAFDPPVGSVLNSIEKSRDRIAYRLTIAHNIEEVV